jgi:hypothetical protein
MSGEIQPPSRSFQFGKNRGIAENLGLIGGSRFRKTEAVAGNKTTPRPRTAGVTTSDADWLQRTHIRQEVAICLGLAQLVDE